MVVQASLDTGLDVGPGLGSSCSLDDSPKQHCIGGDLLNYFARDDCGSGGS
jgi:hypothetical protein